jgi:ELWxxDGT repeat protein
MGGRLYFSGQPAPVVLANNSQLWATDGTASGTQQVTNLDPGASSNLVGVIQPLPTRVLFQFCTSAAPSGCTLYSTDGSSSGTVQIGNDAIGISLYGYSAVLGNQLFYAIQRGTQNVLRVSDGTVAGTQDVYAWPIAGNAFAAGSWGTLFGHVIFTLNDPVLGPTVWTTDGTSAGTRLVADVSPGYVTTGAPLDYVAVGNNIFFEGDAIGPGSELFMMSSTTPNAANDFVTTPMNTPVTISVLANDGAFLVALDPTSVVVTTPPTNGTASVNPSTGTVTYTPNAGYDGSDQFAYTVADLQGHVSNAALVQITLGAAAGPPAGTAPPTTTPTAPATTGGGGDLGTVELLLLLGCLLIHLGRPPPAKQKRRT